MKIVFTILFFTIFYCQAHSQLSVVFNHERCSLDVYVYATDKGKIDIKLYNAYDTMVDEIITEKTNLHFETSFDFRNRTSGIYTVIVDIGNKLSLKKNVNVKK